MIRVRSFGASSAQKGLWLAQKIAPGTLNHALFMWDVNGALDVSVMNSTFRHVLREAEVLRLNFVDDGSGVLVVTRELGDWQPFFLDVSAAPDPEQAAREALADMVAQPFDLERDLLLRLGVVELAADRFLVVIAYHHLVSDGFGAGGVLSRRLSEVYTALADGAEVPELSHPWAAEPVQDAEAGYRASQDFADDVEFWRDYLAHAPAPAQLPRIGLSETMRQELSEPMGSEDRWSQLAGAIGMVSRTLTIPRAEADLWTKAAEAQGIWMSSLVTAAAAVFFRHRCDLPEFLFSMAVGNRGGSASRTPHLAVNVVPVRIRVPLGATFGEVAEALGDETYEIVGHTACHYSDIQRASGTGLSDRGSYGAVVNVGDFMEQLHFAGSPARYLGATTGVFDELSLGTYTDGRADSDLFVRLDAPAHLYSGAELRLIGAELIAYIRAVTTADPQLPIGALDVLSGTERDRLLTASNDTDAPLPDSTVPDLFARQVERTPDADAVVCGESRVSYRTLDVRSSCLAAALRRRGVGPEVVVAVAMSRSVDLVVALLAVAKAGGAALPIEPLHPPERMRSVFRDASPRLVLAEALTIGTVFDDLAIPTILFSDEARSDPDGDAADRAAPGSRVPLRPDHLLAVTYGVGSGGPAKGVAVTHRNMQRFVTDRRLGGDHGGTVWHSTHTFDALARELWAPLLTGGSVIAAPPGEFDVDTLAELQAEHRISTLWLAAGAFSAIAKECPQRLTGLREVWTGSDAVSVDAVRRVLQACPEVTVVNGYGPAEMSALAACHRLVAGEHGQRHAVPIGRPVDNTAVYVLGPGLAPVPVGVTGELYVAGSGLARGYIGRPNQTAERFVACPFGPAGRIMYRTGDRARWAGDGLLEYVGRADAQAMVRGFSIDPAQVEKVLDEHPGVVQSLVVARIDGSGEHRLVGYVVAVRGGAAGEDPEDQASVTRGELRRFAAGRLPEFLVPSMFIMLDRLPVTPNGRLDRTSLPDPDFGDGAYRAPRTDTERVLAEALADVLELDRVGIDDDFFELGGNSLRAIRLAGLIRTELHLEMSIRTLFAARTVAGLSTMWKDLGRSNRPALRRRTREGEVV